MDEASYCPHCGASRPEWSRFCAKCGNPYDGPPRASVSPDPVAPPPAAAASPAVAGLGPEVCPNPRCRARQQVRDRGYCLACGKPYPAAGEAAAPQAPAAPSAARAAARAGGSRLLGWVGTIAVLLVLGWIVEIVGGGSSAASAAATPSAPSSVSGAFVGWEPVDDAHGYAIFTVTNHGTTAATAKCTVSVRDDFGDFGFDALVGQDVAPGQTMRLRMPISVGKGSYQVNSGTVDGC